MTLTPIRGERGRRPTRGLIFAIAIAAVIAACGGGAAPSGSGAPNASGSVAAATGRSGAPGSARATAGASGSNAAGATAATGPTPKPIASVKGTGFMDSKTFKLKAGIFVIRWTITSSDPGGCTAIGAIHSPDGKVSVEVANISLPRKGSETGQKAGVKLNAGTYLVTVATTCSWTAQIYEQ